MALGVSSTFELITGILLILALSVLAYVLGRRHGGRSHPSRLTHFTTSLLGTLFFAWAFAGKLAWAVLIPLSSVILLSNFMPLLLCLTAGLASQTQALGQRCRHAVILAMLGLAAAYTVAPLARPVISPAELASKGRWVGDICLQSHSSTCAPAAAATLLKLAGIQTNEQAMSDACLTSTYGTVPLGLYRGLASGSRAFDRHPQVASSDPGTWSAAGQLPNVALIQFSRSAERQRSGFFMGPRAEGHAIVVLDRAANGDWIIADPAFGRARWSDEQFRSRFTGDAIFLSPR